MIFEFVEITQEEKKMIMERRAESARQEEIKECAEIIKQALERVAELKGSVYMNVDVPRGKTWTLADITSSKIRVSFTK